MTKIRTLLQISVIASLALAAGACSTLADLDPTGLLGGDSTPPSAGQFPDANAPQASDTAIGTTPDLAALPSRPVTSSPAQQQQQAQSLAADGAQVQYSAEALRGGTEAAAPVPGAPPPPSALALAAPPPISAAPAENDAPPTTEAAPPPSAAPVRAPSPRAPASQAAVAPAAASTAPVQTASAPAPAASAALPPGAQPAVPAVPANTPVRRGSTAMAAAAPSDAELGFQPSQAPALDPSISQWVPAPIVAHYRQTASTAAISPSVSGAAVPQRGASDVTGAVVANLGAMSGSPSAAMGGVTPTAVIYFPGDGTAVSAAARNELRGAVKAYKAAGGTIRVVGHSSSRTANMPIEKHLETIFAKSQARADAVAQELIHQGVPADKVLVEAVGDSQPVYYESMPKGEDGNRRAEVFVQN